MLLFVFLGMSFSSLSVRMPLVKHNLGVSATQLGLILLAQGLGALVGLNLIGRLIARFGTRTWVRIGYPAYGIAVLVGAFFVTTHQTIAYAVVAVIAGFAMGFADVSINVDGTALEEQTGRTLMPRLHAGFSIGTLIGAGWGTIGAALNWNLLWMVLPLCILQMAIPFVVQKHLPAGTGLVSKDGGQAVVEGERMDVGSGRRERGWFTPVLIFFGIGILCMTVAEGAAIDWLTLGVKSGYAVSAPVAGLVFSAFTVGMVITRYFGGNIADRIGKGNALKLVAAIGVVGVVLLAVTPRFFGVSGINIWLAVAGAFMWGVGVALGFPLFLSAAGGGEHSARRVGFVATWGYGAFLCGPPLLGFVADRVGLLNMFFVIGAFLLFALLVSGAAGRSRSN
jgi:MFS family permease